MESYSRVRSIKLRRNKPDDPFGFTVRGGQEHGTGIFVSSVTPRSIAHKQGLKTGDQILRVNGYPVSMAIHSECLALMKIRTSLHLKIRSVGMIPVRETSDEPITWRLVESIHSVEAKSQEQQPWETASQNSESQTAQEVKVHIVNGEAGLGCCICRGPPKRPGIFVQSTKSNGVAREAGLRPGDQIIQCNGIQFTEIQFPEAVYHLKASRELRLIVIKGAASDLFPGESSGYNSSASSLNGETITTHVSVGSENSSSSEQISRSVTNGSLPEQDEDRSRSRVALDRNMEWDEVEKVWDTAVTTAGSPRKESLIIEIKGEDPVQKVKEEEQRLLEERKKLEEEQRRVREEAKRLEEEKIKFEEERRKIKEKSEGLSDRSPSSSSNENSSQVGVSPPRPDLAGALTNEILKRTERRELKQREQLGKENGGGGSNNKNAIATPFTAPVDDAKRQQHERLIEEFKRAHRKMFAHTIEEVSKSGSPPREERASFRAKRIQKEVEHARKMVENRVAGIVRQRQLRIERQHQEVQETEREVSKHVTSKGKPKAPPPPLPDPSKISVQPQRTSVTKTPGSINAVDKKKQYGSAEKIIKSSNNNTEILSRPESPLPDYSNTPSPEFVRRHHVNIVNMELERGLTRCGLNETNSKSRFQGQKSHVQKFSSGGILKKNSSSSSSESRDLKTITFGPF